MNPYRIVSHHACLSLRKAALKARRIYRRFFVSARAMSSWPYCDRIPVPIHAKERRDRVILLEPERIFGSLNA